MTDLVTLQIVVFLGCVTGAFAATMIPYWQKLRDYIEAGNRDLKFEYKFLGTAALAIVVSVAISFTLFETFLAQVTAGATLGAIFIQITLASFGANSGLNLFFKSTKVKTAETK